MDLTVICQACLSQDRSLKPLGKLEMLFKAIFRHSFHVFQMGIKCSDLLLCWECHQILNNIEEFHDNVVKAQLTLNRLNKQCSDNDGIKTLSTTSTTQLQQNQSLSVEQKLEYLKEISVVKVEKGDSKEKQQEIPEQSTEQEKKEVRKNENFDENILENLKEETDVEDNYYELLEDITDITISRNRESETTQSPKKIREEKKLNLFQTKIKIKPEKQKKTVQKTCESKVLNDLENNKNNYETDYRLKRNWFKKYINLLNIVPASQSDKVLERLPIMKDSLACTKCNEVCYNERDLTSHMRLHFQKYMCRICADDVIYDEDHIIKHVNTKHKRKNTLRACKNCAKRFISVNELIIHRKECLVYKCNDCTEVFKSRTKIRKHCSKHMSFKCMECNNLKIKNIGQYKKHKYYKHNKKTDAAYCVECDRQFDSDVLMKKHLKTSAKHVKVVPKSFPCPECPNVYARVLTRNYHYNKVHVKITKFRCEICDKYFLNNYRLRQHTASTHNKIPRPKNKFCPHCGRGFSENKILRYHIYTHTGERPHECSYCDAKFAQKYARDMHMKNIHKHGITKNE